ncbi:BTB/POZ domain-containing protein 19 [Platysternon megacephalum]|uniref:BTB/POZ domain-containing protein 19 n=1 Tax=Platysternon megacephalum TaxID=55544 RepID=A0A4D9DMR2_9SAUR|nr:BTB/POZ domain-containing protein 19 [Platysternon megacephalum]
MEDENGYTILNFRSRNPAFTHEPSGTNKGITPPKAPDVPSESIPLPSKWRCTALILGILCLTLLVTAGILGIQVTQALHLASASLKNLSQQLELLQAKNANLSEILQQLTCDRGNHVATNASFAQRIGSGMEKSVTTSILNGKHGKEVKIIVLLMTPDFLR